MHQLCKFISHWRIHYCAKSNKIFRMKYLFCNAVEFGFLKKVLYRSEIFSLVTIGNCDTAFNICVRENACTKRSIVQDFIMWVRKHFSIPLFIGITSIEQKTCRMNHFDYRCHFEARFQEIIINRRSLCIITNTRILIRRVANCIIELHIACFSPFIML